LLEETIVLGRLIAGVGTGWLYTIWWRSVKKSFGEAAKEGSEQFCLLM